MSAVDCNCIAEGDGAPLFLIHGIGASHRAWDAVAADLQKNFRCIRYDLRGHGQSPTAEFPWPLEHFVADLEQLRERTGVAQCHLAGHSLGAMIAACYARDFPQHVLSVALLSTAAHRTAADRAAVLRVVEAVEQNGAAPMMDALAQRWFTDNFRARHPQKVHARKEQVLQTKPEVFAHVFRLYAQTEMSPWLHKITATSLVLTGEDDAGCPPRLNRLIADSLPNSTLVILKNLRHGILLEAPTDVSHALRNFLAAHRT